MSMNDPSRNILFSEKDANRLAVLAVVAMIVAFALVAMKHMGG